MWEGKIKQDEEKLLLIKTTQDKKEQLAKFWKDNHPYDTPELVRIAPQDVDQAYLEWLQAKKKK